MDPKLAKLLQKPKQPNNICEFDEAFHEELASYLMETGNALSTVPSGTSTIAITLSTHLHQKQHMVWYVAPSERMPRFRQFRLNSGLVAC